jgi:hypothetical protein
MQPSNAGNAALSSRAEHAHEWSALWSHFGEYGDQDAHYHVCLTDNEHPAPGYPARDCKAMLIGKGRDCADGAGHEVRLPSRRVRHG